jgi:dienelactone hydrolase
VFLSFISYTFFKFFKFDHKGGTGVLSYSFANANATSSDIVGAVSFHGGLLDFEVQGSMPNPILVLSGGDDDTGTAVEDLESRLVEANSIWQITRYSGKSATATEITIRHYILD